MALHAVIFIVNTKLMLGRRMAMQEDNISPRNWREIAQEAAVQEDPIELRQLIAELERALDDQEQEPFPHSQAA
jgi:hypothetical protein